LVGSFLRFKAIFFFQKLQEGFSKDKTSDRLVVFFSEKKRIKGEIKKEEGIK